MNHTDYSRTLRNAHRKTLQKTSNSSKTTDFGRSEPKELRYAFIAAVLVLASLLHMDPADAYTGDHIRNSTCQAVVHSL